MLQLTTRKTWRTSIYLRHYLKSSTEMVNIQRYLSSAKKEPFHLKYEKKTPVEHVLLRPGMYVGSIDWTQQYHWVYDQSSQQMVKREINYSPALLKIFDEILVNAADNVHRQHNNLTEIRINVNISQVLKDPSIPLTISIQNDGRSIPLEIHEKEQVFIPELIFGHLLTGSNFDDTLERFTGGSHGYGAKLTNIFSKQFELTIHDEEKQQTYHQTWQNNMGTCHPAKLIKESNHQANYIQIRFQPDLERFGLSLLTSSSSEEERHRFQRYLSDISSLYHRRSLDIAGCLPSIKVYYNESLLPVQSFQDYVRLFAPSPSLIELSEQQTSTELNTASLSLQDYNFDIPTFRVNDRLEFSVLPISLLKRFSEKGSPSISSNPPESISFVNNVWTLRGGPHVQYLQNQLMESIQSILLKSHKKEIDSALVNQKSSNHLSQLIKNQCFLFINCKIENPSFDGQTKDALLTKMNQFISSMEISPKALQSFWRFSSSSSSSSSVIDSSSSPLPNYYHEQLLQSILQEIAFQEHYRLFQSMDKTIAQLAQSKNKLLLQVPKLDDAHFAGKKGHSQQCTLILTEGDSAKALAIGGLSEIGRDYYGVLPLRGKVLNVRSVASNQQVIKNQELMNLCKAMNLQFEKTYQDEKEWEELRYGHLLLMCDQDHDGSHIKGLIINFIHYYWPALLQRKDFLQEFITPIVKIRPIGAAAKTNVSTISPAASAATAAASGKGKRTKANNLPSSNSSLAAAAAADGILSFYNLTEYEQWKAKHLLHPKDYKRYFIKYYKGLGTNTNEEGKEYFQQIHLHQKSFISSDLEEANRGKESALIDLVFHKDRAADRKQWLLEKYSPDVYIDFSPSHPSFSSSASDSSSSITDSYGNESAVISSPSSTLTYSDFINKELIHFSFSDNVRSIPHLLDGLKPSQRKVLYGSLLKFSSSTSNKEMKVMQLAGYIAEKTSYHHGEQSLHSTIINMAQQYVGANNLPLLVGVGQFGTRAKGGDDYASPRYIYTKLSPLTRYLFPVEDDPLLTYQEDDGVQIEPEYFLPILPTILLNGSIGIGTGWSTDIPAFNLLDIIDYLLYKIEKDRDAEEVRGESRKEPSPLIPYYYGFKGRIYLDPSASDPSNPTSALQRGPYLSEGKLRVIDRLTIEILELPVMKWTEDYKAFLLKLLEKGEIKSFQEYHTIHSIRFVVTLSSAFQYKHILPANLPSRSTSRKQKKQRKKSPSDVDEDEEGEERDVLNNRENQEKWLQYFKLTSRIHLSNMYVFTPDYQIRQYHRPEQMIDDFYGHRLQYYQYRQQAVFQRVYAHYLLGQNQLSFLESILASKQQQQDETTDRPNLLQILSSSEKKEEMVPVLRSLGLLSLEEMQEQVTRTLEKKYSAERLHPSLRREKIYHPSTTPSSSSLQLEEGEDSNEEATIEPRKKKQSESRTEERSGGYDYLLQMPIYSFTKERYSNLQRRVQETEKKLNDLERLTPHDLWVQDLLQCKEKYLDWQKTWKFD